MELGVSAATVRSNPTYARRKLTDYLTEWVQPGTCTEVAGDTGLGALRCTGKAAPRRTRGHETNPDVATFGNDHSFPAGAEVPLNTGQTVMCELLTPAG